MKRIITLLLLIGISLSAFSTLVTFKVSMKGCEIEYDSVFIVGEHTNWEFVLMEDEGDSLYSVMMNLTAGDSAGFYFITIGYWDQNYKDYREVIPDSCDYSVEYSSTHWEGDRGFVVPEENTTLAYIWGSCEIPPEYNPVRSTDYNTELLNVYPNPASGSLTINWSGALKNGWIEIMDLSGKTIRSINLQDSVSSYQLDISDISSGVYLIKVSDNNSSEYRKIIIY